MSEDLTTQVPPAQRSRTGLGLAVVLAVVGAGVLVLALGRVWSEVPGAPGVTIPSFGDRVLGRDLAPGALACGYLGLAGVVALIATRGWGRVLIGLLLAAGAIGALVDVLPLGFGDTLTTRTATHLAHCTSDGCSSDRVVAPAFSGWPWVASGAAALLFMGGVLTVVRGRTWKGLGSSYEAPGAKPVEPVTDKGVWDALDRGDDPTA